MDIVMWKMILLSLVAVAGGFSTICVAVGWLIKIVNAVRKPSQSIKARFEKHDQTLDDQQKEMKELRRQFAFMLRAIPLLLQDDLVILTHLRTQNNSGKMQQQEDKIHDFLLDRQ